MIVFKFSKIPTLILVCCCIYFLSSCKKDKCNDKETETSYLSNDDKSKVPYHGMDTLQFLHNSTDTIVFLGYGTDTFFTNDQLTVEGCPLRFADLEGHQIVFENKTGGTDDIDLRLFSESQGYVDLSIKYKKEFREGEPNIGPPYDLASVSLNGVIYNNIEFIPAKSGAGKIYYNTSQGILKIEVPGDTLTLLP